MSFKSIVGVIFCLGFMFSVLVSPASSHQDIGIEVGKPIFIDVNGDTIALSKIDPCVLR